MMWIGAMALSACMFMVPKHEGEGLPATDPHEFFNAPENCTCCHETSARESGVEPHEFTVDIVENCMRCHDGSKIGNSHPVGVSEDEEFEDMEIPEDLPVDEEAGITCGTCHNPHLPCYTPERFTNVQEPEGFRTVEGVEVAFYKSYLLRRHVPGEGIDPTCASCHAEYF